METEIKLLKEREVDQKNKASGYETLLRDGIPLNEHFLALNNKYNNEQESLNKSYNLQEEEKKHQEKQNALKKEKITIAKTDFENISKKLTSAKELADKNQKQ